MCYCLQKMKIGFDITMLVYSGSGVATYTYNLVSELLKNDKENEYHLFYSSLRRPKNFYYLNELKKLGGYIHSWRFPPKLLKLWWGKWHIIPIEWFTGKMDFFHTSDFLRPPLLKGTVGITTIHDLTWKIYPQWHTEDVIKAHTLKLQKTIKYNDVILCPSEWTKKDLLKEYPEAINNKIYVICEGVDKKFKPAKKENRLKTLKKYNINQLYIIYVGAIEPRKNLIRLIKAFNLLIKEKKYSNLNLVIGGRAGWKNQNVFDLVKKLKLENKVIFTGFIQDKDLSALYSNAQCSCYVSLYEGFGLPPLEAQSCGCPVVTSNISSIPEVVGDSAVLINPYKIKEIKNGIKECLQNKKIISQKGLLNSKKFTWKNTAKRFIKIISNEK